MTGAHGRSPLGLLAEAACNAPGVVGVAFYSLDATHEHARVVATASWKASATAQAPPLKSHFSGVWRCVDVLVAQHPLFQQVIGTRSSTVSSRRAFFSPDTTAATGATGTDPVESFEVHLRPLTAAEEVIGVIAIGVDARQAEPSLAPLLQTFTAAAELLLGAAADADRAVQRSTDLEMVQRVIDTVVSRLVVDDVLAQIASTARELLQAIGAVVYLYREQEGVLERRAIAGPPSGTLVIGQRLGLDESVHSIAVRTRERVYITDVFTDPRVPPAFREGFRRNGAASYLIVPFRFEGQVLGTLGLGFAAHATFPPEQAELAETLANFAAIALHNAQVHETTVRWAQEQEALRRVSQAVVSGADATAVLQEIADAARAGLQADRAALWLYHPAQETLELRAISGLQLPGELSTVVPLIRPAGSIRRRLVQTREPVVVRDPSELPEGVQIHHRRVMQELGLRRLVITPIVHEGTVTGSLALGYVEEREFPAATLALASTLANHVAIAIVHARLHDEVEARVREQEALHRISRAVVSGVDRQVILQEIAEAAKEGTGADWVRLWSYNPTNDTVQPEAIAGLVIPGDPPVGPRLPVSRTALGGVIYERQPLTVNDGRLPPRASEYMRRQFRELGLRSMLVVPVQHEGRVLGVLALAFLDSRTFPPAVLSLAETMANHAAAAIAHAQLYGQTVHRTLQLEALHRISRAVVARMDTSAVLEETADAARVALEADRIALWLLSAGDHGQELHAISGLRSAEEPTVGFRHRDAPPVATAQTGPVVLQAGKLPPETSAHLREVFQELGLQSMLIVPVLNEGSALGFLCAGYTSKADMPPDLITLAETIADHAAAAIGHAQLYEATVRRAEELALLDAISSRLTANLDLPVVLRSIAEAAFEFLKADGISILGLRDGIYLDPLARVGAMEQVSLPTMLMTELRPPVVALQTKKTVLVPDVATSEIVAPEVRANLEQAGIKATAMVPMLHQGEGIGIMSLAYLRTPEFTETSLHLMEELASRAAAAIVNARRFQEVSTLAARDALTGLLNHREFHLNLRDQIERAQASRSSVSLVMLDLDNFKQVNDEYGHQQGDQTLRSIAGLLLQEVRTSDFVARYGGEEFAIILPGASKDLASRVAERVRLSIETYALPEAGPGGLPLTVSVGVACFPEDADLPNALVSAADQALYAAKRSGKNRVVTANGEDHRS